MNIGTNIHMWITLLLAVIAASSAMYGLWQALHNRTKSGIFFGVLAIVLSVAFFFGYGSGNAHQVLTQRGGIQHVKIHEAPDSIRTTPRPGVLARQDSADFSEERAQADKYVKAATDAAKENRQ